MPVEEAPRPGPSLRLRAVGDVQLGRGWPERRAKLPPGDASVIFDDVRELLRDADVTFGNLETVLARASRRVSVVDAFDEMLASDLQRFAVVELGDEDIAKGQEVGINDYQIKLDREKLIRSIYGFLTGK